MRQNLCYQLSSHQYTQCYPQSIWKFGTWHYHSPAWTPTNQQFGFRPRKSTELNLLTQVDFLLDALKRGYQLDIIYTDFSKAFDRVPLNILVHKLKMIVFEKVTCMIVDRLLKLALFFLKLFIFYLACLKAVIFLFNLLYQWYK